MGIGNGDQTDLVRFTAPVSKITERTYGWSGVYRPKSTRWFEASFALTMM